MNIHEYQAKILLKKYGVAVPPFKVVTNLDEVQEAIDELSLKEAVLKVQIHAGGRGKAGGVKFAKNKDEILKYAKELIGKKIVNNQTGPLGLVSHKVLISPPLKIKKEFYLAAIIDRQRAIPLLIASKEGGMEIEEVAEKNPESILTIPLTLDGQVLEEEKLNSFMGWDKKQGGALAKSLAKAFTETDSLLFEINPLVETEEGSVFALDAKCTVDDNALYRQPEIEAFYDESQMTKNEILAKQYDLAYVGLTGEVGCMVNGAGLAMATMDIIKSSGGYPANFLDVGGSATKEKIAHGFKIIMMDPHVKSIFVNIFGGIMDCAVLAQGIVEATKEDFVKIPLIIRMEGTNVEKGKKILRESGLSIITAETMEEGARKAVEAWS